MSDSIGRSDTPPLPYQLAGDGNRRANGPRRSKLRRGKAVSARRKAALVNVNWLPIDPAPPNGMMSSNGSNSSLNSSSEFSTEDDLLKDPYALTLHFVTDPGRSIKTKNLIKPLIKWFDPSFKLFNIAERSKPNGFQGDLNEIERDVFPALSVMLFLNHDGESTENKVEETQEHLTRKPWRYHHHAATPTKVYLCEPNNQNFYTTEHEMPLWGVRQVHYGNEHLRFMLYTSRDTWHDMIRFYCLLLGRDVEYQKDDFCYFLIHSTDNKTDVQFALKRAPKDCTCRPLNSAFLQFKVLDIGDLVPLMPHSCSPISPQRWQTTDPDGNVTLLLVGRKNINNNVPRVKPRRHSIDTLQTLIAPKAIKPRVGAPLRQRRVSVISPSLPSVTDDDEEDQLSC
ncbi:protein FAM124A-like isoform X1 [Asterias rubens]|uniref:protein FAM124A-like isoform X1 n=1 Tax=Asterias rubens TaxID=7604 RepID=UPI001454E6C0|nr:protein FAM124A-like isoform X1 [Asterias rubens]